MRKLGFWEKIKHPKSWSVRQWSRNFPPRAEATKFHPTHDEHAPPNAEFDGKDEIVDGAERFQHGDRIIRQAVDGHVGRLRKQTRGKPNENGEPEERSQRPIF